MIHLFLIYIWDNFYVLYKICIEIYFIFAYGYPSVLAPCVKIVHLILKNGAYNSSVVRRLFQHNHSQSLLKMSILRSHNVLSNSCLMRSIPSEQWTHAIISHSYFKSAPSPPKLRKDNLVWFDLFRGNFPIMKFKELKMYEQ